MGSCCSCFKSNPELQDILITDENPAGIPTNPDEDEEITTTNKIIVHQNSMTNTIIAQFYDNNASTSSSTDYTLFPFLKRHLIDIKFDLNKDHFEMPPIGTVRDDSNSYSIVLFGDTDTGKTTFFNQFRLYIDDFSESERKSYTLRIIASIILSIQKIYAYLKNQETPVNFENEKLIEEINEIKVDEMRKTYSVPSDLFDKIVSVWNEKIILETYSEQWKALHLCQFVPDFISKISKYRAADYIPENSEILQTKICTINNNINNRISDENYLSTSTLATSPQMLAFSFRDMVLLLRDAGGEKSHRDKWKSFTFDSGFFFVSLADFNQKPLEVSFEQTDLKATSSTESTESSGKDQVNDFQIFESLRIFKQTIRKYFVGPQKPLFVILTKYDIFKNIISKDQKCFTTVFPDFTGDSTDSDQCQKYIGNMFAKVAQECNPELKINICTSIDCLSQTLVFQVTKKIVKKIKKY